MAYEAKTKPTEVSVADFIATVENPQRRADAETLCTLFEDISGEPPRMWGPSIIGFGRYHYRYASGHEGDAPRLGFSPRKAQTVAVVLSKVRSEHAAKVLAELPGDFAAECVMRMLGMEPVQRDILDKIETTLRTEFMSNVARTSKRDSHEVMAEIFNNFDRQTEARFMAALEGKSNESADRIKALMFVFEDLGKLDSGGVQTLLRAVDKADLALALKGASDALRTLFFSNMSERGGKLLKEDMAAMGPVRLKDVDAAQTRMVATAKELSARGEIVLSDGKSDDELIY